MGNYSVRRNKLLAGWQIDIAEAVFQGLSNKEIAVKVLKANPDDPKDMQSKVNKVQRVLKAENFLAYYKSMVTEWSVHNVGKALNKLTEQIDHKQPWLANKAANDILQRVPRSLLTDESENSVVVKVEGMPELGSPDQEE